MVITHAHNDHTNDLESILSLCHTRHKRIEELNKPWQDAYATRWKRYTEAMEEYQGKGREPARPEQPDLFADHWVTLWMNPGCFKKYAASLDLRNSASLRDIRVLGVDEEYELRPPTPKEGAGVRLRVLPAYHDEILSIGYSTGLLFRVGCGVNGEGTVTEKSILFTGDTGVGRVDRRTGKLEEIWQRYRVSEPDILVPHVGSVKKCELEKKKHMVEKERLDFDSMLYENHLGLLGLVRVITALRPKVCLVSEFGEEMKPFLGEFLLTVRRCVDIINPGHDAVILPCGLFLLYNLGDNSLYSLTQEKFVQVGKSSFKRSKNLNCFFHYFDGEVPDEGDFDMKELEKEFMDNIKTWREIFPSRPEWDGTRAGKKKEPASRSGKRAGSRRVSGKGGRRRGRLPG